MKHDQQKPASVSQVEQEALAQATGTGVSRRNLLGIGAAGIFGWLTFGKTRNGLVIPGLTGQGSSVSADANTIIYSYNYDGERGLTIKAPEDGTPLRRSPVGEGGEYDKSRSTIAIIAVKGDGFGGYDRFAVAIPRLGTQWQVNILDAYTIETWHYTGDGKAVEDWMVQTSGGQTQQVARAKDGSQMQLEEMGLYSLMPFESKVLKVIREPKGNNVLSPEDVLAKHIDLNYNDPNVGHGPVDLTVQR